MEAALRGTRCQAGSLLPQGTVLMGHQEEKGHLGQGHLAERFRHVG